MTFKSTLFIQTALPEAEVVFIDNGQVHKESFAADKKQSSHLFKTIKKVLGQKKPAQILVVSGPGGFTGLRVGVSSANAIAYALGISVAKVNTFDYLRTRAGRDIPVAQPGGWGVLFQEKAGAQIEHLSEKEYETRTAGMNHLIMGAIKNKLKLSSGEVLQKILQKAELSWQKSIEPDYFRKPHITPAKN